MRKHKMPKRLSKAAIEDFHPNIQLALSSRTSRHNNPFCKAYYSPPVSVATAC